MSPTSRAAPRRRAAAALALLVALVAWPAQAQRIDETLDIALADGERARFRVNRPANADALPAIVLLGGFERGAGALDLVPAESAVLVGYDYPLEMPRHIGWREIPRLMRAIERSIATTRQALVAVHARLAEHPAVDAQRITIVGVSLGAPFALLAAADAPYAALVVVHGFADVERTVRHQFARRWVPEYGRAGLLGAWLAQSLLTTLIAHPDPREAIPRLSGDQQVLLISARVDSFVPAQVRADLQAALRASPAPLTERQTDGDHLRGGSDVETLRRLLGIALPWLQTRALL